MQGLWDPTGQGNKKTRALIGVKRMGDLDVKPFQIAIKRICSEEADVKTLEVCSLWEAYLADPNWHPFKIVTDKEGRAKVYN